MLFKIYVLLINLTIYACTQALSSSLIVTFNYKASVHEKLLRFGQCTSLVFEIPIRLARIDEKVPQLPYLRICLVRPAWTYGLSHVVWIELLQFSFRDVHPSLLDFVRHGGGFGSERWYLAHSLESAGAWHSLVNSSLQVLS
ncbi:unnamed protein product [Microthlaspi erraticum]|uniref:Uncharacterized protein n=1 Tax=Microthlaspi erraticum TaxID=1685480 RepID=A0A6D2KUY2_9BRAS|nr:unnamed protein product [Microthlaspi erraticum]